MRVSILNASHVKKKIRSIKFLLISGKNIFKKKKNPQFEFWNFNTIHVQIGEKRDLSVKIFDVHILEVVNYSLL
jgi:hypothetical protein